MVTEELKTVLQYTASNPGLNHFLEHHVNILYIFHQLKFTVITQHCFTKNLCLSDYHFCFMNGKSQVQALQTDNLPLVKFPSFSMVIWEEIQEWCLQIAHDCFLKHSFHYVIHSSPYCWWYIATAVDKMSLNKWKIGRILFWYSQAATTNSVFREKGIWQPDVTEDEIYCSVSLVLMGNNDHATGVFSLVLSNDRVISE